MSPFKRGTLWWGRIKDQTGAQHRLSFKTSDAATAKRIESMLAALADQHRWTALDAVITGELTLAELADAYQRNVIVDLENELRDGTRRLDLSPLVSEWSAAMARKGKPSLPLQKKYVMQVRRLMPSDRPYYRKDFTTKALADFLHHLEVGQPNRYQAALSRFAKFLIQRGILNANPLDHVERAAENPARLFELSHEEVGRLLSALPEHDRPWHALMAATGVEWGAIASAQVRDLDPDALTFRAKGTKTRHRDRTVMIRKGPEADLVRAHWRALHALPAAPLFRLTGHRSALQRLQDAAKAVGLPKMRIHDWRHVFAVQAVRDGIPYHIIAHQLGHSNTIMVQKVYGRFAVTLGDLRAVEHSEMPKSVTPHLTLEA